MALPNFNEQTTLLFFFFLQGMIFAGLLYRKGIQEEQVASKWLSVFVFLCCLYLVPWMLGHLNWYALDGYSDFLFFVPFHQLFFLGPVMYMYTRSQLNPSFVFTWRDGWHFVPGALYLLYSLVIFVVDFFVLDEYYFYADGRDKDLAKWYQITGLLALLTYAVLSFQYYRAYRKAINATVSFADGIRFDWMRQFLLAVLLLVFLRAFFLIILPDWGSFGDKWWYYFFFGCVTYFIAFAGYGNTVKSLVPFDAPPFSDEPELTDEVVPTKPTTEVQDIEVWKAKVLDYIEAKSAYQDSKLTLADVAQALGTTSKQVSTVINQGFGMNFNDFVNDFRLREVKNRFQRGEQAHFTILAIALDCGFNSKTTFNRVFKRATGQTPLQYLAKISTES